MDPVGQSPGQRSGQRWWLADLRRFAFAFAVGFALRLLVCFLAGYGFLAMVGCSGGVDVPRDEAGEPSERGGPLTCDGGTRGTWPEGFESTVPGACPDVAVTPTACREDYTCECVLRNLAPMFCGIGALVPTCAGGVKQPVVVSCVVDP